MTSMSYDPTTEIGKVRLLATDTNATAYVFEDVEIETFLSLESGNLRRAAALALETMASSDAYILKRIKSLDLQTDGPAVSQELRARAADLRKQAFEAEGREDGGAWDYAEWGVSDFARRERLYNQRLRGAL